MCFDAPMTQARPPVLVVSGCKILSINCCMRASIFKFIHHRKSRVPEPRGSITRVCVPPPACAPATGALSLAMKWAKMDATEMLLAKKWFFCGGEFEHC